MDSSLGGGKKHLKGGKRRSTYNLEVEAHDVRSRVNVITADPPHEVCALVLAGRRHDAEIYGPEACEGTGQVQAEGAVADYVLGAHDRLVGNGQGAGPRPSVDGSPPRWLNPRADRRPGD